MHTNIGGFFSLDESKRIELPALGSESLPVITVLSCPATNDQQVASSRDAAPTAFLRVAANDNRARVAGAPAQFALPTHHPSLPATLPKTPGFPWGAVLGLVPAIPILLLLARLV